MSKLLDLRNKSIEKVKVVEHIIFKPRSFKSEMIKMFSIIAIVSVLGWGISHADNLNPFTDNGIETATQNFSALGNVSEITDSTITLTDAKGSDKSGNTTYTLNISHLEKVETSAYTPLIITDIKVGDKIIAQGLTNGTTFFIKRIVSFSSDVKPLEVATTTVATSTPETASTITEVSTSTPESGSNEQSTTTPEVSTTTETATTTEEATTTPTIIETIQDTVGNVIDTVTETVQNVIDTVTGNTEPAPEPTPETPPNPEPVI